MSSAPSPLFLKTISQIIAGTFYMRVGLLSSSASLLATSLDTSSIFQPMSLVYERSASSSSSLCYSDFLLQLGSLFSSSPSNTPSRPIFRRSPLISFYRWDCFCSSFTLGIYLQSMRRNDRRKRKPWLTTMRDECSPINSRAM